MQPIHTIAVIGGTGKSGKYLVNQLLHQGFSLKLLVRNSDKLHTLPSSASVITGDVRDYEAVKSLLKDCQAIISTLGVGLPPSEPTLFSKATGHIIQAMQECQVRQYIVITGLNVDTPFDKKGVKTKAATEWMLQNYPTSTMDKQKEYSILASSDVDWTLVRLPMIELTDESYKVSISLEDCPGDKISATDLANFLINQLTDRNYSRQAPFIANL